MRRRAVRAHPLFDRTPRRLGQGGGWFHQTIGDEIDNDGDMLVVLDVLARQVGTRGIFSDWPATLTYCAN